MRKLATVNKIREMMLEMKDFCESSEFERMVNPKRHDVKKLEYDIILDIIGAEIAQLKGFSTADDDDDEFDEF